MIEIFEEPFAPSYADISIAFEVRSVLDATLAEHALTAPYIKDYDTELPPATWPRRFDMSRWGILAARLDSRRVGGAVIAFDTPGVDMLERRADLAVLWDIRVAPDARGRGLGSCLFAAAEAWAAARGCRELKVETQNINAPACRFYRRRGCGLVAVVHGAYPNLPGEIQLIFAKRLGP